MKKGFTLIELLAVIVILAIIALIATPIVLNIIDETKENAVKRSAEMYLNAVEYAIADIVTNKGGLSTANYYITEEGNLCEQELVNNKCPKNKEIEIKVKGEKPTSGKIEIKGMQINTAEVVLSEKRIEKTEEGKIILKGENQSKEPVCTLASDSEKTGTELGAKYECEVKPGTKYTFFVLSNNEEDGSTNLIMDSNINSDGVAIKSNDIENKGFVAWHEDFNKPTSGPVTAMTYLYNATKDWTNISPLNYEYYDGGVNPEQYVSYDSFTSKNGILTITGTEVTIIGTTDEPLRTRMPIESEIPSHNGTNGYLYDYMYNSGIQKNPLGDEMYGSITGYWTLSSWKYQTPHAYFASCYGSASDWSGGFSSNTDGGVRPVINVEL